MPLCKICVKSVFDGIHLSDGGIIHKSCLEYIQTRVLNTENDIYNKQRIIGSLSREIEKRKGVMFWFVSIFSKPSLDLADIETEVKVAQENIRQLLTSLNSLKNNAARIYDFFLTYPPDWDERRMQVIQRDGDQCSACGSWKNLHLHHITPLSKGGNNNTVNLRILCEKCHSKKHGSREFSNEFDNTETAFSQRVANIRYAIKNKKRVKFGYKKPTDRGHKQRIVKPADLIDIAHVRDGGSTLCVRGYCELRNEERTFALKRMRGLKIL